MIDQYTASYWGDHIIEPVKFYQSIQLALKMGANIFLECGPQPTLIKIMKRSLSEDITSFSPWIVQLILKSKFMM